VEHTSVDRNAQGAMAQTSSSGVLLRADEPHWIKVKNPNAPARICQAAGSSLTAELFN